MSLIYLIGMPGAGKSYWAREISRAYTLPLVDMDEYIEQREGNTISGIFRLYGENVFRQKERDTLAIIAANMKAAVVACGGGTPCFFDNMAQMMKTGIVIYLKASVPTLVSHLYTEVHQRPLLATENIDMLLTRMLQARTAVYEKAHHILDADNISLANFAQILSHV